MYLCFHLKTKYLKSKIKITHGIGRFMENQQIK